MGDLQDIGTDYIDKIRKFIREVNKNYPIIFGYLFGSRANGTYNSMSDVDIALMFEKDYSDTEDIFTRGDIIEIGQKFFKESIDVVNLKKAPLILKYSIVHEGIVIKDEGSGQRADFESLTLREYFDFQYYSQYYNGAVIERIKQGNYFRG